MRVRDVDKFRYGLFLKKAEEFRLEMVHAGENGRWNALGLNGIHCMISSCDALTTYFLGKRSAGERHEDVAALLSEIQDIDPALRREKVAQVLSVLGPKTRVEYESDLFTEAEARTLGKQVGRFYEWAKRVLPGG